MCGALRQMIHLGAACLALCRTAPFPPLPCVIGWKKVGRAIWHERSRESWERGIAHERSNLPHANGDRWLLTVNGMWCGMSQTSRPLRAMLERD